MISKAVRRARPGRSVFLAGVGWIVGAAGRASTARRCRATSARRQPYRAGSTSSSLGGADRQRVRRPRTSSATAVHRLARRPERHRLCQRSAAARRAKDQADALARRARARPAGRPVPRRDDRARHALAAVPLELARGREFRRAGRRVRPVAIDYGAARRRRRLVGDEARQDNVRRAARPAGTSAGHGRICSIRSIRALATARSSPREAHDAIAEALGFNVARRTRL